jgi:hypothetical protein
MINLTKKLISIPSRKLLSKRKFKRRKVFTNKSNNRYNK